MTIIIQNRLFKKNSLVARKNYIAIVLLLFCTAFQTTAIAQTVLGTVTNEAVAPIQATDKVVNELPVAFVHQALRARVPSVQVVKNGSPGTEPLLV